MDVIVEHKRQEGLTVVLVEQNARLALRAADRAYLIEIGKVVKEGSGSELANDPQLAEIYLGAGKAGRRRRMLHRRSFEALRAGYRSGAWSPVEVAESALRHAQKVQGELNAFAWLDPRRALSAAEASARRWKSGAPIGALDGMPFTVKEFAAVQGWPTRRGSRVTSAEPVRTARCSSTGCSMPAWCFSARRARRNSTGKA